MIVNDTEHQMIETLQWVNFTTEWGNQIFMYQYGWISKYNVGWTQGAKEYLQYDAIYTNFQNVNDYTGHCFIYMSLNLGHH